MLARLLAGLLIVSSGSLLAQETAGLNEESEYVRGVKAFAEGDFKRAADLWLADAYLGSPDAQFNIGVLYVEGKGLPKDRGEAIFWFTKAADQGHREAQYNLGHLLLEETGDIEKVREGISWWRKSAEAGFPIAQFNYGRALYFGIGTEEDREGSRQWFERAANGGNEKAVDFLAENADNFVDAPPPIEISEPLAIRAPDPAVENTVLPNSDLISRSEYVLVKDKPVLVHARFNKFSPIITRLDARMLLRVVARNKDWIQAEVPGGLPGWVANESIKVERGLVEITAGVAQVHADPTESEESNVIGELLSGSRVMLLEQQPGWTRVQLPESIPAWIEDEGVRSVKAKPEDIAKVWQNQRVKQKIEALDSRSPVVAAVTPQPAAEPADESTSVTGQEVADSTTPQRRIDTVIESQSEPREPDVTPETRASADDTDSDAGAKVSTDTVVAKGIVASEEQLQNVARGLESASAGSAGSPAPGADSEEDSLISIRRTRADNAAIRTGASATGEVLLRLPAKTLVDVLDRNRGFAEVSIPGGVPVWIEDQDVRRRSDEEVVIEGRRVRARPQPNQNQQVVGLLPGGSIVRLLEERDGWLRVVAPEWITGWIEESALEVPTIGAGIEKLWSQQASQLMARYLGERVTELATKPQQYDPALVGTGIRNDNAWLFEQTSRKFTLQLFSMQNRETAESLLASLNQRGQFFSTVVKGDRWYFLLLGKFLTPEAAEAVAETLPRWASGARVRSLARLQVNRCKKLDLYSEDEAKGLAELCR